MWMSSRTAADNTVCPLTLCDVRRQNKEINVTTHIHTYSRFGNFTSILEYATCFGIFSYFCAFLVFIIFLFLASHSPCRLSARHLLYVFEGAFCFSDCYACHPDTHYFLLFFSAAVAVAAAASGTEIKFEPNWKQKQRCQKSSQKKMHSPTSYRTTEKQKLHCTEAAAEAAAFEHNLWVTLIVHFLLCQFSVFSVLILLSFSCLVCVSLRLPVYPSPSTPRDWLTATTTTAAVAAAAVAAAASTAVFSLAVVLSFSHTFRSVSIACGECEWGLCICRVLHNVSHRFLCSTGADAYARTRSITSYNTYYVYVLVFDI